MFFKHYFNYLSPALLTIGLGFIVLIPIRAYYLDPIDLGIYSFVMGISLSMSALSSLGSNIVMSSHYLKLDNIERGRMLVSLLLFDMLIGLIIISTIIIIVNIFYSEMQEFISNDFYYLLVMALIGSFLAIPWNTVSYFMILKKDSKQHAIIETVAFIIGAVVSTITLYLGYKVWALFYGLIFASIGRGTLCLFYIKLNGQLGNIKYWFWQSSILGAPAIPSNMIYGVKPLIEKLIINYSFGLSILGLYSHSQTYRDIMFQFYKSFSKSVTHDLLLFCKTGKLEEDLKLVYKRAIAVISFLGIACFALSEDIITYITFGKFTESAKFVPAWYLVVLFSFWGLPYVQLLSYLKQSWHINISIIYSTIFGLVLAFILSLYIGIWGPLIGIISINLFIVLMNRRKAIKMGFVSPFEREILSVITCYVILLFSTDFLDKFQQYIISLGAIIILCAKYNIYRSLKKMKKTISL